MVNLLQAEPEPLEIDLNRTAVIVVDMQNAFVSNGGMFDLWGYDISSSNKIIRPIKEIISTAREKGIKVIYIAHRVSGDSRELSPNTPFWYNIAMKDYREKPEMRDRLIIKDTWGAEIIDELTPEEDDLLIEKPRYSAFSGTNLDMVLRAHDIKYVAFTGVATNICVESSLRDAYHFEYFPVLISDAAATGSPSAQEVTINNVKQCFGWVTTRGNFSKALG